MDLTTESLENLPNDIIRSIALTLDLEDITYLCATSKRFSNLICNDNIFWRRKYIQDFGQPNVEVGNKANWALLYLSKFEGDIFVYGLNTAGQLGLGDEKYIDFPTPIPNLRAKYLDANNGKTFIIDYQYNVWVCGFNAQRGLGLPTNTKEILTPRRLYNIKAKYLSVGLYVTALIDFEDNVWIIGIDMSYNTFYSKLNPKGKLYKLPNIKALKVACGGNYTYIIDLDNKLWIAGPSHNNDLMIIPIPNFNQKVKNITKNGSHVIDLFDNVWDLYIDEYRLSTLSLDEYKNIDIRKPNKIPNIKARRIAYDILEHLLYIIDFNDNLWLYVPAGLFLISTIKCLEIAASYRRVLIIDIENNVWASDREHMFTMYNTFTKLPDIKAIHVAVDNGCSFIIGNTTDDELNVPIILVDYDTIIRGFQYGVIIAYYIDPNLQYLAKPGNQMVTFNHLHVGLMLAEGRIQGNDFLPPL